MIPIRLVVRNFMCYRDNVPPLSFEDIHVACLCGDNGNGKSALLDAMTWALWGQARAKSDDDLVHQGLMEMAVEFDFAVGEQRYHVLRQHSRPRKPGQSGITILEFQLVGEDERRTPIASGREAQQEINKKLRMDYETFINSAYLRQGHADAFTIKRPAERKQLLADILGLGFYDELEERARNLRRLKETDCLELTRNIADIDMELSHRGEYQTEFDGIKTALLNLEKQIAEKQAFLASLRQRRDELEYKKGQLRQIDKELEQAAGELEFWEKQAKEHGTRIAGYERLVARRGEVEAAYQELVATRKVKDDFDVKARLLLDIRESKSQAERAIEKAKAVLESEQIIMVSRVRELEARSGSLAQLQAELGQARAKQSEMERQEQTLETTRQRAQELSARVSSLEDRGARLAGEIKELEEKLDLLSHGDACCPLCERELEPGGRELIAGKYRTQKQARVKETEACQERLNGSKVELKALGTLIVQEGARLRKERDALQNRISLRTKDIAEAEKAQSELPGAREKAAQIGERLAQEDFAPAERQRLREMSAQEQALGYDSARHSQVRQVIDKLSYSEEMKRQIDEADRSLPQERLALTEAEQMVADRQAAREKNKQRQQSLSQEVAALPDLVAELDRQEPELRHVVGQQTEENKRLGATQEKLRRCRELALAREDKARLLHQATDEEQVYKELAEAFGKRGIQALLIESALPEIETEANRLLGRMTDNRMHVKLETQRETKKGNVQETLDIRVSDELGSRDYEMFSGGEAFRINFALRIALSKLLARRAGAPLPTLIIDEGFGTQDSSGREKLVEAISSIQEDFDKILVITHIDELKNAFPVRIDVIKTAEGSTFSVSS